MYTRVSYRVLENLTKPSSQSPNRVVHLRGLGTTSSLCSASAVVAHRQFRAEAEPVLSKPKAPSQRPRPHAPGERLAQDHRPARPSFRSSSPSRPRGKFREVHIAAKVKELCDAGDLDGAIECCKQAPCGLQGPAAWNIVLKLALEGGRYNLAWELFQQMKKRGVGPSSVTYATFLYAYAKANPEVLTPTQLERAQKFYKSWLDLVSNARTKFLVRRVTAIHPAAAYINVLANANAYQAIWDTFYELSPEGPLAPNEYVFTTMFVALGKRDRVDNSDKNPASSFTPPADGPDPSTPPSVDALDVQAQDASDVKLLWRMALRALERQPFPLDAHLLTAVLRALQRGREGEHELALSIIDDYIVKGLESAPSVDTKLDLNPRLLDAVLAAYDLAKRPDLSQRLVGALRAPNHPQRSAVTNGAMQYLLKAYADQGDTAQIQRTIDWMLREGAVRNGLRVEPGSSNWSLAFRACLNAQDWTTTKELTKRLAGTVNSGRFIDAETIYMVLKSAYVLRPNDVRLHERQLRQALDAVYYVVTLWPKDSAESHAAYAKTNPDKVERRLVFQNALGDLVKQILEEFNGLNTVSAFHDLSFRLEKMRTKFQKRVVARYENDM